MSIPWQETKLLIAVLEEFSRIETGDDPVDVARSIIDHVRATPPVQGPPDVSLLRGETGVVNARVSYFPEVTDIQWADDDYDEGRGFPLFPGGVEDEEG
jgi:hypothetical protein